MHTFYFLVAPVWLACMFAAGEHGIAATVFAVILSFVIGFVVDAINAYRREQTMPAVSADDFMSPGQQRKLYQSRHKRHRYR